MNPIQELGKVGRMVFADVAKHLGDGNNWEFRPDEVSAQFLGELVEKVNDWRLCVFLTKDGKWSIGPSGKPNWSSAKMPDDIRLNIIIQPEKIAAAIHRYLSKVIVYHEFQMNRLVELELV